MPQDLQHNVRIEQSPKYLQYTEGLSESAPTPLWVDKGRTGVIRIALKIRKASDDYATGDSQMTPNILSH